MVRPIGTIPFKKTSTTLIPYLDKPEMEGILQLPKRDIFIRSA